MILKHAIFFAVATLIALAMPARAADQFNAGQKQELETVIHDYLISHPEVFRDAVEKLQVQEQEAEQKRVVDAAKAVKPITPEDHIRGDAKAPVKIIEFSDLECPFCKSFHSSMKKVMEDYGKIGKVAWVYRHFPIDQLHPKARKEAQAAECAGEVGGAEKFWAYADKVYEVTPSNNKLDLALLPKFAEQLGLDKAKFEICLQGDDKGGKYAAHIQANEDDATASGGQGTPYSLVMSAKGNISIINGAEPYDSVKAKIETALKDQ